MHGIQRWRLLKTPNRPSVPAKFIFSFLAKWPAVSVYKVYMAPLRPIFFARVLCAILVNREFYQNN